MADTTGTQTTTSSIPGQASSGTQVSEAVAASLRSLASARKAQRNRRHRDRALVLLTAGLTVSGVWGVTSMWRDRSVAVGATQGSPEAAVSALGRTPVPPAAAAPAPAPTEVLGAQNEGTALSNATVFAAVSAPAVGEQWVGRSVAATEQVDPAVCETAANTKPWRQAVDTCTAEFAKAPSALSALVIAKVHYKRGHVQEAGQWAHKAVMLDAQLPEAFVIVAYAAEYESRTQDAAAAYRHYLSLAPHGWHAGQARRGLRRNTVAR